MPSPIKLRTVLLRCSRLMSEMINEVLLPFELNYSLWQVIYLVNEHQEITSIDLAHLLKVSKPSIAKRVHMLNEMQILKSTVSMDKREKKLSLTAHGASIFQRCTQHIDEFEKNLLNEFEPNDLEITIQSLHRLLNVLEHRATGDIHE